VKKHVHSTGAPEAIGPYSQAILADGWLWCSGQVALDPATGKLVEGGIEEQTRRVLENLSAVVAEAGGTLADVVKTTVFLKDLGDYATVNGIYAEYLGESRPARAAVEVARLPLDVLVEIDCVARISG
jgi:2-iminobutanoate/2-iminopropanoate deaminase